VALGRAARAGPGGFYSYEWLENLAGCRMRTPTGSIEWQEREVGDSYLHPSEPEVTRFEPGRALGLRVGHDRGAARGRAHPARRVRLEACAMLAYGVALIEIPHFVMERKMLLGIKERAEAA
jgi:hypothetical protein